MSHLNTYLISPRTEGRDRPQVMGRTSGWNLKQSLCKAADVFLNAVGSEEEQKWLNTEATCDEIRELTTSLLQKHPRFVNLIDSNLANGRKRRNGDSAICDSIRELWAKLSEPDIVASEGGRQIRRSILGAMCGKSTTYADAKEFIEGLLSREAFYGAKRRREDAIENGEPHRMKPRSDLLEVTCPNALAWIEERITFHTQPSLCQVKWKHDY
ncbi:unnamed protein product [Sphacelaria rigidula]